MQIDDIANHFESLRHVFAMVASERAEAILSCCRVVATALNDGHKVLIMGNGGSAADAQHFSAELVGRFILERKALPAIALTTDSSILTAVGNDYGFDEIFRRQVEALAQPGDVVIGISTSGMSTNVFNALAAANAIGCKTIGFLGRDGGKIAGIVDVDLTVPVQETPLVQGAHAAIIHIVCDLVEKELFG